MQLEVYTFIVAQEKNAHGGGGAILNSKYNPDINFNSGFRKTSQGGGGAM